MLDLEVIADPATAVAALDPVRARVLAVLVEPGSASSVAAAIGLTRQQVNYHLRTLESHGLVELVEERQRRGLIERVVQSTAKTYVMSPAAFGASAVDPTRTDRLSTQYLIALAARIIREVSDLARGADRAGKPLATLAIDTEIRFATADDRASFSAELAEAFTALAAKYHDERAPRGRWHRVVVGAHPISPPHSQ